MYESYIFNVDPEKPYDHSISLSTLDRIIYEDCHYEGGRVYALHEKVSEEPYYYSLDYLARKVGCDYQQAEEFKDYFQELDATEQMIDVFAEWVRKSGVDKGLEYFRKLSQELRAVTRVSEEDALELECRNNDGGFDPYGFHTIGEGEYIPEWEHTQPQWYQTLLHKIDRASYERLKEFGKRLYNDNYLNEDQKRVAFDRYNRRKKRLDYELRKNLKPTARNFLRKVRTATPRNIGRVGAFLYKAQQGEIDTADPPTEAEWWLIWKDYQNRKTSFK
jgi:hypothetical protein